MITFTDAEHERIRNAVQKAEVNTSGEIVAYLMESSDYYGIAYFRSMLICCVTALLIAFALLMTSQGWELGWLDTSTGILLVAAFGAAVGLLLVWVSPAMKRFFAGNARITRTTRLQAFRAFVEAELFATRDRTGILLFVSLLEHRVEVIADKGINSVVKQHVWEEVVELIVNGIRSTSLTDGLVAGITRCGELLHEHGVDIQASDTNELSDNLRIKRDL